MKDWPLEDYLNPVFAENRVKKSIENMTGLKVVEVNVHVQGVSIENEKKEEPKEEGTQENETTEVSQE